VVTVPKKRKTGVPTGNAGEYFVMGELLRQGFDAQLADRNTKGYDVLVGQSTDKALRKVQVKSVRSGPWYVSMSQFDESNLDMVTIYVLLGSENSMDAVKYFIATNREIAGKVEQPTSWKEKGESTGFMSLRSVSPFENRWATLRAKN
jgi:hypothetical protein